MRRFFFRIARSQDILGICLRALLVIIVLFFTGSMWFETWKEGYPVLIGIAIGWLIGRRLYPKIRSKSEVNDDPPNITGRHSSGV